MMKMTKTIMITVMAMINMKNLGSRDSGEMGGGVLLHVNYLTPCDLYRVETSEVTRHHPKVTAST